MIIGTIDFSVLLISGDKTMKNSVEAMERKKKGREMINWMRRNKKKVKENQLTYNLTC